MSLNRLVAFVEAQRIGAVRQFDDNVVGDSFVAVVVEKLQTEATGLHANGGIGLRVEVFRASEDFSGDLVFLQGNAGLRQGMVGQVAEQFTQGFGLAQCVTVNEFLNLAETAFSISQRNCGCGGRDSHVTLDLGSLLSSGKESTFTIL